MGNYLYNGKELPQKPVAEGYPCEHVTYAKVDDYNGIKFDFVKFEKRQNSLYNIFTKLRREQQDYLSP